MIATAATTTGATAEDLVDFSRDVLPILSDHCFTCHGPDEAARQAGLRLDIESEAKSDDYAAIVPGDAENSQLIDRIFHEDPDVVMPPPASVKQPTEAQRQTLVRWIDQGATWQGHWAFEPVQAAPTTFDRLRDSIDHHIGQKLAASDMRRNPPTDAATWFRRVSLDLTGLPPTIDQMQRFLHDPNRPAAVEDLLGSPHFGERMAWDWLEAARYADTHGYQKDNVRTMWVWRDWVIRAFNDNMPFDQFTIEQLAGDLLPDSTLQQQVATAFNRNHRINAEAGAIAEEYRTEYVIDRTDTVATVWLGLTAGCARCHDHKFDPLSQADFYRLSAFFNNIEERGNDGVGAAAVPQMVVPIEGFDEKIKDAQRNLSDATQRLASTAKQNAEGFKFWMIEQQAILDSGQYFLSLQADQVSGRSAGSTFTKIADDSILFGGANPLNDVHEATFALNVLPPIRRIRLEAIPDESLTGGSLARSFDGNFLLSDVEIDFNEQPQPIRSASVDQLSQAAPPMPVAKSSQTVIDGDPLSGWTVGPGVRQTMTATLELATPIEAREDDSLTIRLVYQSREEQQMIGRFRISVQVGEAGPDAAEMSINRYRALLRNDSSDLLTDYRETAPEFIELRRDRDAARDRLADLRRRSQTQVMVMRERAGPPRPTHVLGRGIYDQLGDVVEPDVPGFLKMDTGSDRKSAASPDRKDRLWLARWITDDENPLTARVTVNRFWQQIFGTGLVKTANDFGYQGDRPSHPELLDALAANFVSSGWDVKALIREIVLSETYGRGDVVSEPALAMDPDNRWLARFPRRRLPAPMLRDQALHLSGLLQPMLFGPPVRPWQPAGLWEAVAGVNSNTTRYETDRGDALFRRSLYTFWKRGMPPPSMVLFDAATREVCSVGRSTTNSPLQALAVLNDPNFAVPAIVMASKALTASADGGDQSLGGFGDRDRGSIM